MKSESLDGEDSDQEDFVYPQSYLNELYQKFKRFLYTSYYRTRRLNYSHRLYPTRKKIEDVSFRSYELYNLHGRDELLSMMLEECGEEDVIFDIGANVGTYSLASASKYPDSNILAFEPNVEMFEKLKINLECNDFENIKIYNMGISDKDGQRPFYMSSYPEASSFGRKSSERWGGKVKSVKKVDVRKLDTIVKETRMCPDRLKLDVEGHGLKALKGGETILKEFKPTIYMELHEVGSEKDETRVKEFLSELYYSIDKRGKIWICRPENWRE